MTVSPKKSLRTQYALGTFLVTALLIILVLFSWAFLSYRLFLSDYEQEIASRMEIAAASLESMVEQTDYMGMMRQANSLMTTQGVVGVNVIDVNAHSLIQKGDFVGFPLQQPILHNNKQIGVIQVSFSDRPIKDKIRSLLLLGVP